MVLLPLQQWVIFTWQIKGMVISYLVVREPIINHNK